MLRASLVAVILVAVSSQAAHAGGYLGLGVGTAPSVGDDLFEANGRSAKILGGMRWAQFSVEGSVGGFALGQPNSRAELDAYQAQASAKLSLPLGSGFEAFGRAGLQHAWLTSDNTANDMDGNGYLLGAGFEYRLNLGIGSGSIFVDYTYAKANLTGERSQQLDLSTRMWTLGITVGI
jgi:opacity protein-like surface antigen